MIFAFFQKNVQRLTIIILSASLAYLDIILPMVFAIVVNHLARAASVLVNAQSVMEFLN
jgi:hypothetical protein